MADTELAMKTNDAIKEKYNSGSDLTEIVSYVDSLLEKYAHLHIARKVNKGLNLPKNEDLATIYEWKAIIEYYRLKNDACYSFAYLAHAIRDAVMCAKNKELYYPILAEKFYKENDLNRAIELYRLSGDGHKKRLNELEQQHIKAEQQRKNARDYFEQSSEEAKPKVGKLPKKAKARKKAAITNDKNIEEKKKDVVEKTTEVTVEPQAKRFRFTYDFCGLGGDIIKFGSIQHFGKKVGVSLVKPNAFQIDKIEELNMLCSKHGSLLTVFHLAREDHSSHQPLLVTEEVCLIEEYFEKEFGGLGGPDQVTSQIWWDHIEEKFQLIFGGVIQGLIYLYRSDRTCGDLSFSTFVSIHSGEGRILPSLDPKHKVEDDVNQLIDVMKSVIKLANTKGTQTYDFVVKLPSELVHFFHFLSTFMKKEIPGSFLVDHPYFWTSEERVSFAYRLNRVVKREKLKRFVTRELIFVTDDIYDYWWERLEGAYLQIQRKGNPSEEGPNEEGSNEEGPSEEQPAPPPPKGYVKVRPYVLSSDIIRFYHAVYTHINDREYCEGKTASDAEIEADLTYFFPSFYIDMFETICHVWETCKRTGTTFSVTHLREITNFRFSDSEIKTGLKTENWSG